MSDLSRVGVVGFGLMGAGSRRCVPARSWT